MTHLRCIEDTQCQLENEAWRQEFLRDARVAGLSQHTITSYGSACKDFLDFICGLDLKLVTHREVREWIHWLQAQGATSTTLGQRKYALSAFFKFLERIDVVKSAPTRLIQNRKIHRKTPRHLSINEIERLLAACESLRDLVVHQMLWVTGCRRAELLGMKVGDINWNERMIHVTGKGDKDRLVPMTRDAAANLEKYIGIRKTGPVFLADEPTQTGGLQLQRGRYWIGFWREYRKCPDGTVEVVLRSKCLGLPRNSSSEPVRYAALCSMGTSW